MTDPFGNTVGYTYDPNGNRSSIQYPVFKHVYYLFDELDRVSLGGNETHNLQME